MKRALFILAAIIVFAAPASSQKKSTGTSPSKHISIGKQSGQPASSATEGGAGKVKGGTSQPKYVKITRQVTKLPSLEIIDDSTWFSDFDGDRNIDGNETFTIHLTLVNNGPGPGTGLKALVSEKNNLTGITYNPEVILGNLDSGMTRHIEIPVFATADLSSSSAEFSVKISEANGFGTGVYSILLSTQAFRPPDVRVVDLTSRDSANIVKVQPFSVNVLVQNLGQGIAHGVEASLLLPKDVLVLSEKQSLKTAALDPGQTLDGKFDLVVKESFAGDSIPVKVRVREKYGIYAHDTLVWLAVRQKAGKKMIVQGSEQPSSVEIVKGSLSSDVDKNIPASGRIHSNRFALVIGNEHYRNAGSNEEDVIYAINDAGIFYKYARTTMGIPELNCILLRDATSGEMITNIRNIIERVKLRPDSAELVIFYAGHGFPDIESQAPFLVPVDGDVSNLQTTISLASVYGQLAATGAKRITVFLDACFSGGGRGEYGLLAQTRMAKIAPKQETLGGRMVVFSAATGTQVANPYPEQKHGMFTYFLLKKIQESKGRCTYGDLFDFLKFNVNENSLILNRQAQQPDIQTSSDAEGVWRNWSFN